MARVAGVDLEFKQGLMDMIEAYFERAGYEMPQNNRRQAYVPAGSQVVLNPVGTAPCFIAEVNGKPIICLPGVPRELDYLWDREISAWVRKRFWLLDQKVTYRVLRVVGLSESKVDRLTSDLMGAGKNPELGLLASSGEIMMRLTATARGDTGAEALIRPVENEIRSRLGDRIFGIDHETLEGVIDTMLRGRGLTLAILETFSAGLAAQRLYRIPSSQLLDSRVIPDQERLLGLLGDNVGPVIFDKRDLRQSPLPAGIGVPFRSAWNMTSRVTFDSPNVQGQQRDRGARQDPGRSPSCGCFCQKG